MPDFEVVDQNGDIVRSSDLIGKKTIIYFYPKDSTPGCTSEACSLRDGYADLVAAGYNVIGVSRDSVASHQRFILKNELPFTLLSDPSTQMLQAFGAWGEKKMYGKTTTGVIRTTYIIDEEGRIIKAWNKINTATHGKVIKKFLEQPEQ